eukprot:4454063-Amphidinium_carterae.2
MGFVLHEHDDDIIAQTMILEQFIVEVLRVFGLVQCTSESCRCGHNSKNPSAETARTQERQAKAAK